MSKRKTISLTLLIATVLAAFGSWRWSISKLAPDDEYQRRLRGDVPNTTSGVTAPV